MSIDIRSGVVRPAAWSLLLTTMVIEPDPGRSEPRSSMNLNGAPRAIVLKMPALQVATVKSSSPATRAGTASAPSVK